MKKNNYQKLPQDKFLNALIDTIYYIQNSTENIAKLIQSDSEETKYSYYEEKKQIKTKQLKDTGVYYNAETDELLVKLNTFNLTLSIKEYSKVKESFSINTIKLLDWILIESRNTPEKRRIINLFLDDYQAIRGLKNRANLLEKMKSSIKLLNNIYMEYEYCQFKAKKKELVSKKMKLIDSELTMNRGNLVVPFSEAFYESIPRKLFAYIPNDYFLTDDKNYRYAAFFIRKLAISKKINWGKERENIISIYSLYGKVLRNIQEIKPTFDRCILTPFEKNMNAIPNISWSYRGVRPKKYKEFEKAFLEIEWKDYPELKEKKERGDEDISDIDDFNWDMDLT